ncbi:hypothetical protein NHX12_022753 [Muraenolepis orangiensis]|uniref:Sideroflexin-3 n=1 Tax=Muraenolepis orangiensis TaxID=630683 RepID=A0A9Q0IVB7_9TELE|nr:hypothetical protein NHX12_022753 [Muraenolepis orangiensis]
MSGELPLNINIKEPRWDQGTFMGRAQHFFMVTDPRNVLLSSETLEDARVTVEAYRAGTVKPGLTEDALWKAKYIYDSAFHPDTGEKMVVIGRMSAQVPMNMSITGSMLTFYRTTPAVVFWQWVNQSFNAVVNYTNRSGDAPLTVNQLGVAYISATTGAVVTALGFKSLATRLPQRELKYGIPVTDENDNRLGESPGAAKQAIFQVIVSRIGMAMPAMAIPPVIMNSLEKRAFMKVSVCVCVCVCVCVWLVLSCLECGAHNSLGPPTCPHVVSDAAHVAEMCAEPVRPAPDLHASPVIISQWRGSPVVFTSRRGTPGMRCFRCDACD